MKIPFFDNKQERENQEASVGSTSRCCQGFGPSHQGEKLLWSCVPPCRGQTFTEGEAFLSWELGDQLGGKADLVFRLLSSSLSSLLHSSSLVPHNPFPDPLLSCPLPCRELSKGRKLFNTPVCPPNPVVIPWVPLPSLLATLLPPLPSLPTPILSVCSLLPFPFALSSFFPSAPWLPSRLVWGVVTLG